MILIQIVLGYLSCRLSGESIHQFLHPVMHDDGGVVDELGVGDIVSINEEAVRHQWVPVVKVAELQSDAVTVLDALIEKQRGIERQLEEIATQMLHILFDYDVDYLPCETKIVKLEGANLNCLVVKTIQLICWLAENFIFLSKKILLFSDIGLSIMACYNI